MATYMDIEKVQYETASGIRAPLCKLYFCRHCLKLRSSDDVSHEVDSHYCPNCLENMPSAEAKLKKNRCANCFDCPSCSHSLSTRATTTTSAAVAASPSDDPSKPAAPRKVFYLACSFCRWTSRDVGIADQPVANGGWKDQENPHSKRINSLLEYYRQLAAREKAEKEKKKYIRRRSYLHYSDKYGLSNIASRRRTGVTTGVGNLSLKEEDMKLVDVDPSIAMDTVEDLPEDIFTKPVELAHETSLSQRLACPEWQCTVTGELYPRHKRMLIKRSLRCKQCEHNLSKHEFNPASIKFKIQLVALHLVPEIRIMSLPQLAVNTESNVILSVLNPLDAVTHVTLLPQDKGDDGWTNAKLSLPPSELVMAARDDAAEFDDGSEQNTGFKDDPSVVVFRKANKMGFFIKVIPLLQEEEVKISFLLRYDYKNVTTSITSPEAKDPETVWLQHHVFMSLGNAQSSSG